MSDNDSQNLLLLAIEQLKINYEALHYPCIALLIAKHYRSLSNANFTKDQQEDYANYSKSWLTCYVSNQRHSQKMQNHLHDFIQLCEFSALTP
jgi:hypothetical protein